MTGLANLDFGHFEGSTGFVEEWGEMNHIHAHLSKTLR